MHMGGKPLKAYRNQHPRFLVASQSLRAPSPQGELPHEWRIGPTFLYEETKQGRLHRLEVRCLIRFGVTDVLAWLKGTLYDWLLRRLDQDVHVRTGGISLHRHLVDDEARAKPRYQRERDKLRREGATEALTSIQPFGQAAHASRG